LSECNNEIDALCKTTGVNKYKPTVADKKQFDIKLKKLINDSNNGLFEKKIYKIANKTEEKTVVHQFFHPLKKIENKDKKYKCVCIVCNGIVSFTYRISTNLLTHLRLHNRDETDNRLKTWFENWEKSKTSTHKEGNILT